MNDEELGVIQSPRPAPICWLSDLLMPAPAVFGFCVRSGNWALVGADSETNAPRIIVSSKSSSFFLADILFTPLAIDRSSHKIQGLAFLVGRSKLRPR